MVGIWIYDYADTCGVKYVSKLSEKQFFGNKTLWSNPRA
jgi:hypothetical protein